MSLKPKVQPTPSGAPWPLRGGRDRYTLAALVFGIFAALAITGLHIGMTSSTETRYAQMGREMLESGDWIIPTLNGAPLLEKPPFEYWVNAASIAVFGVNDLAPRIPNLVAGLLVLFVTAAAARRFAPAADASADRSARGPFAILALATMPAFLIQAYTVSIDIWLMLTTLVAGVCLLESERTDGRPGVKWVLLLHGALGVAMLAKGPLSLALVGGAGLIVAIVRRDLRPLRPFVHPLGIALFLALSVPWYVAANARIPGLLHDLLTRRLFGGLASSKDFHGHSFWYVWIPLLGTFPWLAAMEASLRSWFKGGGWRKGPGLPLLVLALSAPVLFTLSKARLMSYASPAFPWIALLVVLAWPTPATDPQAEASRTRRRELFRATIGTALVAVALSIISVTSSAEDDGVSARPSRVAFGVGLAGAAVAVAGLVARRRGRFVGATYAGTAVVACGLLVVIGAMAVAHPTRFDSSKPLWTEIASVRRPGEELGAVLPYEGDWGLLPWYSGEPVRFFNYPTDAMMVDAAQYKPDLFRPRDALVEWWRAPTRRFLLIRLRDLKKSERTKYLADAASFEVARSTRYAVLTNLPLAQPKN